MTSRRFQRGEVPVGCIVCLIFLAIVAMIAIKVTPLINRMGDFKRQVVILADKANRIEYNNKVILEQILKHADKLNLPVTSENVVIKRTKARIVIDIHYELDVEFPGYTYHWVKDLHEDRPMF